MENYYEYDKNMFMIFVDFEQANKSVNRQQLRIALRNFGITEKLIKMIEISNSNTYCNVRYQGERRELSPFLR